MEEKERQKKERKEKKKREENKREKQQSGQWRVPYSLTKSFGMY